MGNLKNHTLKLDYPIYTAKFLNDKTLLVAGGGGEGNNGIPNKMTVIAVQPENLKKPLKRYRELTLNEKEDSVMSLDANNGVILAGINENSIMMKKGVNKHLRKFKFADDHLKFVQSCQIHSNTNSTMYQKITAISLDGSTAVIIMSDNPSTIYIIDSSDDLEEKFKIMTDGDAKDVAISPDGKLMCYITSKTFEAISLVTGRSVFKKDIPIGMSRVRFINNDETIIVGSKDSNAVIAKFSIANSKLIQQRVILKNLKGTTSMDVNVKNGLIAVATSDYSILVIRISDLTLVKKLNNVHKFAITKVVFSNDGRFLASGSAANTVNVIEIPKGLAQSRSILASIFRSFLTIFIVGILAIASQYLFKEGYLHLAYDKGLELYNSYKPKDSSQYFVVEEVDSNIFSTTINPSSFDVKDSTIKGDIISYSGDISQTTIESNIYYTTESDLSISTSTTEKQFIEQVSSFLEETFDAPAVSDQIEPSEICKDDFAQTVTNAVEEDYKRDENQDQLLKADTNQEKQPLEKLDTLNHSTSSEEYEVTKQLSLEESVLPSDEATLENSQTQEVEVETTQQIHPMKDEYDASSILETSSLTMEASTPSSKAVEVTKEIIRKVTETKEVTSTLSIVEVETKFETSTEIQYVTKIETETFEVVIYTSEPQSDIAVIAQEATPSENFEVSSRSLSISNGETETEINNDHFTTNEIEQSTNKEMALNDTQLEASVDTGHLISIEATKIFLDENIIYETASLAPHTTPVDFSIQIEPEIQTFTDEEEAQLVAEKEIVSSLIGSFVTESVSVPEYSIEIEDDIVSFANGEDAEEYVKDQIESQLENN